MTIAEKLLRGEYGGVEFDFVDGAFSGGRKTIIHEFINSDTAQYEDVGRRARRFPLRIEINNDGSDDGSNYFVKRDALIEILEKSGHHVLIHPLLGAYPVVQDKEFQFFENIGRLGNCVFNVSFVEVSQDGRPSTGIDSFVTGDKDTVSFIIQKTDNIADLQKQKFDKFLPENCFSLPAKKVIQNSIKNIADIFDTVSEFIIDTNGLSDFRVMVDEFRNLSPVDINLISSDILELFAVSEDLINSKNLAFEAYQNFFIFNEEFLDIGATASIEAAKRNHILFRDMIQSISCGYATNSAAQIDYSTESDLDNAQEIILSQQDKVAQLQTDDSIMYNELESLTVTTVLVFNQERLEVSSIIEIDTPAIGLTELVYQYYGNQDNYDIILSLNGFVNPSLISGTVKILTNE